MVSGLADMGTVFTGDFAGNCIATWSRHCINTGGRYYVIFQGIEGWTETSARFGVINDFGDLVPVEP